MFQATISTGNYQLPHVSESQIRYSDSSWDQGVNNGQPPHNFAPSYSDNAVVDSFFWDNQANYDVPSSHTLTLPRLSSHNLWMSNDRFRRSYRSKAFIRYGNNGFCIHPDVLNDQVSHEAKPAFLLQPEIYNVGCHFTKQINSSHWTTLTPNRDRPIGAPFAPFSPKIQPLPVHEITDSSRAECSNHVMPVHHSNTNTNFVITQTLRHELRWWKIRGKHKSSPFQAMNDNKAVTPATLVFLLQTIKTYLENYGRSVPFLH